MFRKLICALGFLALLAISSNASAQMWTAVASTGAIEDTAIGNYYAGSSSLAFRAGATGTVGANYNVTNPKDTGNPAWTTMEFTAKNPGGSPATFAQAILYRAPRGTASGASSVCIAIAPVSASATTTTCTFSSSMIDFNNYRYFVRVLLGRDSTSTVVAAFEVRIF
ncbi:MAG TPA: hypothetical protein VKM72_09465 [Thermoanaerobaculia bacterium]|nr:hypothetical protein [Thermoanaerobaculia bacterium]